MFLDWTTRAEPANDQALRQAQQDCFMVSEAVQAAEQVDSAKDIAAARSAAAAARATEDAAGIGPFAAEDAPGVSDFAADAAAAAADADATKVPLVQSDFELLRNVTLQPRVGVREGLKDFRPVPPEFFSPFGDDPKKSLAEVAERNGTPPPAANPLDEPTADECYAEWGRYYDVPPGVVDPGAKHSDEYVAFYDGRPVDYDADPTELRSRVAAALGVHPARLAIAYLGDYSTL